ncbi:MAG: tyrosine-type recombinase/integrase [Ignavibacteriales bacterium]|nr:tyrosine-type recombinase/integrase [Ignavibacteriales bacterium]
MPWLNTIPNNSPDPKKKLYIFWYDKNSRNTKMKVTPFHNTREGRKEAKKLLLMMQSDIANDNFTAATGIRILDIKLSSAIQKFLDSRLLTKKGSQAYKQPVIKFISIIGDLPIKKYQPVHGIKFLKILKEQELSGNTLASYTKHLSIIWNWFVENKYCRANIIKTVPRERVPIKTIPEEDRKIIFDYFKEHDKQYRTIQYFFTRFTFLTGFRPSTTLTLTPEDFDFNEGFIHYRNVKGKRTSLFPIHDELKDLIDQYKYLFIPGQKIFHYKRSDSLHFFSNAMKKLGMNYNLKMLRKTLGSLAANNISVYAAQVLLDHQNSQTTQDFYIQAMMKQIKDDINNKIKFE